MLYLIIVVIIWLLMGIMLAKALSLSFKNKIIFIIVLPGAILFYLAVFLKLRLDKWKK